MIKKKDPYKGAILPFFACLCNKKEYKTLSSLSNHIKIDHQDKQDQFRVPRGVPLGRVKKLSKYQNHFLKKLFKEQYNGNLQYSDKEIRDIFKENVSLVSELVKNHQSQQFEDQLLKENIKLQSFWKQIKRDKINMVMKKYYLSFLISACNQKLVLVQEYQNDEVFQNLMNSFQDEYLDKSNNDHNSGIKIEQIRDEEN
ncbi:hypothetical protein ABPG72_015942 [Tetrahymena utriculariae]